MKRRLTRIVERQIASHPSPFVGFPTQPKRSILVTLHAGPQGTVIEENDVVVAGVLDRRPEVPRRAYQLLLNGLPFGIRNQIAHHLDCRNATGDSEGESRRQSTEARSGGYVDVDVQKAPGEGEVLIFTVAGAFSVKGSMREVADRLSTEEWATFELSESEDTVTIRSIHVVGIRGGAHRKRGHMGLTP